MDNHNSWKRTEDKEVDLVDLFRGLCRRWKQALACAAACAVIMGGYGYVRSASDAKVPSPGTADSEELTKEQQQAVAAAVEMQKEIQGLEEYLGHSVLMQVDPYHKNMAVMLYSIDGAKSKDVQRITESYLNYVVNGGAAGALKQSKSAGTGWDMDSSYLSELITAYQKIYSPSYQVSVDTDTQDIVAGESLFFVEVTGSDAKMAARLAESVQSALEGYAAEVDKTAGGHTLTLLSCEESESADSSLQAQQHEKRVQLTSGRANLKAAVDVFSEGQKAEYGKQAGVEDVLGTSVETDNGGHAGFQIKYIVLGLAGGIFAYCCAFACWYLFKDTVKSEGELKRMYAFPYYGTVSLGRQAAEQTSTLKLLNRARLACRKQGIKKLCAASDFALQEKEKACLENIAGQLKKFGIELSVAENAVADAAGWDTIAEAGNVLLVCRIGTTAHRMIDEAMAFYMENGVHVVGSMAFLKDS